MTNQTKERWEERFDNDFSEQLSWDDERSDWVEQDIKSFISQVKQSAYDKAIEVLEKEIENLPELAFTVSSLRKVISEITKLKKK